ncbi:MAG TPA: type I phosphomannose isomerase catalytic subunit [Fimbriiglobus sp.]|jgi:mannose-6-phosphate isomerase
MLYPLKFEPIFKSMLWGGDRLRPWLNKPSSPEPTGEAWVLSDVDGSESVVANGPLAGRTLRSLVQELRVDPHVAAKLSLGRFPLLCKFLDTRQELSVQVHPNDVQANARHPGQSGKTEAWYVIDRDEKTSRLYAGFKPGVTAESFKSAMASKTIPKTLHAFTPNPGDCVFLPAGTVHAIGSNLTVFEVQQTSDITYRLYDWDRIESKTGQARQLHVDDGLACADFSRGPCGPQVPVVESDSPVKRERLVVCEYFSLHRIVGANPFPVAGGQIVVCIGGSASILNRANEYSFVSGDTYLLPAGNSTYTVIPTGPVTVLEVGLGEGN